MKPLGMISWRWQDEIVNFTLANIGGSIKNKMLKKDASRINIVAQSIHNKWQSGEWVNADICKAPAKTLFHIPASTVSRQPNSCEK